jgi:cytochrome c553
MKRLAHALFLLPLLSVFVVTGAWADAKAGAQKAAVCAACHGADGNSPMGQYPDLAQQTARYTYMQLRDFKEGRRKDPLMSPMAANLSREDMLDLADYFAQQKHRPSGFKTDPAKVAEGKRIADAALCTMCHLGGFSGQNEVPRMAGQEYEYTVKQLTDFRDRRRTNDAGTMTSVTRGLTDEQIDALAQYTTSLY